MQKPAKIENLHFACSMLEEVRLQFKEAGEELLTYLIDMAYLEANDRIRAMRSGEVTSALKETALQLDREEAIGLLDGSQHGKRADRSDSQEDRPPQPACPSRRS